MPNFGDFESYGEPLAVTEERGHVSTVWQARKIGAGNRLFVIKCYAPRPRAAAPDQAGDALAKDRALEFLDGVKQIKKAQEDGGSNLAPIHDLGKSATEAWYATDHYPRNNLKAWIARRGGVDSAALRHVVSSVVAACLSLKRSRGYSHGNLKPSNVFLVGQPRPLKKTPLVATDAYPAAPIQLAGLDAGDKTEVGELLGQVVEAQDLRNIGELILQLVEGRLLTRSDDYNYPVQRSSIWDILGKDADYWLKLCNELVNPQLSIETINLESLASRFRPAIAPKKLLMVAAAIGGLLIVGAGVYFGIGKVRQGAERRQLAQQQEYSNAVQQAREAFSQQDYSNALASASRALKLRSADSEAERIKSDAQAKIDEMRYAAALQAGRAALQQSEFKNAIAQAELALQVRPGDNVATTLRDDAQRQLQLQADQNALKTALDAAGAAEAGGDWPTAARHWNEAKRLGGTAPAIGTGLEFVVALDRAREKIPMAQTNAAAGPMEAQLATNACGEILAGLPRPALWTGNQPRSTAVTALSNQVVALWLRADNLIRSNALSAVEMEQKYAGATNAAVAAFLRHDFREATNQAALALLIKPRDTAALRIISNSQAAEKSVVEQMQALQNATNRAVAAFDAKNYTEATNQATVALSLHPGDPVATKVISDTKARLADLAMTAQQNEHNYSAATNAAARALAQSKWEEATNQALTALMVRPNDTAATALLNQGNTGLAAAATLARARDQKYAAATNNAASLLAAGRFDEATNQANIALSIRTNDPFALKVISNANDQLARIARQTAELELKFEQATNAAGNALAARNYGLATNQAGLALTIRTNDPTARAIIASANDALVAAARDALQQQERFQNATNSAAAALAKSDFQQASDAARTALAIRTNDAVALRLKAQADQGLDLVAARNLFASGDYDGALKICSKYNNSGEFAAVAETTRAEQQALTSATQRAASGDYSFIDELKQQPYSGKAKFAALLSTAGNERALLLDLEQLKTTNNWVTVQTRLTGTASTPLLDKKPFRDLRDWADAQAKALDERRAQKQTDLDTRFETLLTTLNVSKPKWLQMPGARNAKRYPSDVMSDDQKDYYRKQVKALEDEFNQLKLLQDKDRASYFPKLRKSIDQW